MATARADLAALPSSRLPSPVVPAIMSLAGAWAAAIACGSHRARIQAKDDTMRIGIVLLIILALWPWHAGAQEGRIILVSADRATSCQVEGELRWYHPRGAGQTACEWAAELRSAIGSDWGYTAGASLFVLGNVITFSFPLWVALGADVYTVTAVIVVGEVIDVVGIYVLGEEAFHDLKGTLYDMAGQLDDQINQLGDHMNRLSDQIRRLKPSSLAWS